MNTVPLLKGEIAFGDVVGPFTGATLYVYLDAITGADIASEIVATYVEREVAFDPRTAKALSFVIAGKAPDPDASYVVRVHLDIDGDREVSQGDFISTQSYPVITSGHPGELSIVVRLVK